MGFVSKWYLAQGSMAASGVDSMLNVLGPVILLISALLTAGYLLTIVIRAFIVEKAGHEEAPAVKRNDASLSMLLPLIVLASLGLIIGIFPNAIIDLLNNIAVTLL